MLNTTGGVTFDARCRALRETKLAHTLAKIEQNGYMDGDDYSTYPKPEGYRYTPIYREGENFIMGAMGNAVNFKAFLENQPVYIDRLEILAGRWCDMLPHYRAQGRAYDRHFPYDDLKPLQGLYNINSGIGADSHCACDFNLGIQLGYDGFLEKIHAAMARLPAGDAGAQEMLAAEEMVVLAIQAFIRRHVARAQAMLAAEEDPAVQATLRDMINANRHIVNSPPQSFLQACQWISWFNVLSRMYDRDGAGCNIDVILYPFFKRDMESGLLDAEKAKFILANLLLTDVRYFQLSGCDEDDRDLTNPLSFLILDAAHALNISANLTVRVHDNIDPAFMKKAVYYLFTDRNGWPRFSGDRGLMHYMKNRGVTKKHARNRIAVGCNWMALPGLEYPINDCVKINVARVFEVALTEMRQGGERSTGRLYGLFQSHLQRAVDVTAKGINHHLDYQRYVMPELVMNLMMVGTLENGKDISECAQFHTMGVDGVGLGTVADSFAALQQRIEREGVLGWDELFAALDANYAGVANERVRLMLKSAEKYCAGNSLGDAWAQRISRAFAQTVHEYPMPEGRELVPGWFSWSSTILFGKAVGPTPDGRFAHTPVTHGANPSPGFRKDGAASAMATGVALTQAAYGNTCPLQLEFDPKLSVDEGGLERVEQLLRTHFEMGGTLVNINILDRETILAAHANPMAHPALVVRVTGFTAYFVTLSPEFRQLVVDRFVEGF